jgi:hypothetical protein
MARKPAPKKAQKSKKARKPKKARKAKEQKLAQAIKPKPDRLSNPLLADSAIHPDLKPLSKAMTTALAWSHAVADCYTNMLAERDSRGMPKTGEWPDSPALERARARHAAAVKDWQRECAQKGEKVLIADFIEPRWTELMREWRGYYRDWCAAIATAKEAAKSPRVAAIMDAGEARPAHRWTTQTIIDLDNLAGTLHPSRTGGVDGFGFIRCGLPPLPTNFPARVEALGKRVSELRSISVTAVATRSAMTRPVPVAEAAKAAGMRCDLLLKRLRLRMYPIAGPKRAFQAELEHIIVAVPEKLKRLRLWGDQNYPAT